jgi:GTPase SAR1 family protein
MKWYPEFLNVVPSAIKIFVGNKIDLREQAAKHAKDSKSAPIARDTARAVIENELKCKYVECSALTREGLK